MKSKIQSIAIVAIFILILALPLLTVSLSGSEHAAEENRYLAPLPTILLDDGSINPNLGTEFKAWLEDHIGFRTDMVKFSAWLKLNVFGQSSSDRVHIGKDGWYYYTPDNNMEIATGTYPLSEETLQSILQNHLATRDKLAAKGMEYVIILPCSKVSIYPEYVREGDGQVKETPVDIVANYLEANSDLKIIRLKEALLAEKENHQLYYKTDTHWNQVGAYIGYQEIIKRMKEFGLCSTDAVEVDYNDITYQGEFGAMLGHSSLLPPESSKGVLLKNDLSVLNPQNAFYQGFSQLVWEENIPTSCHYYENASVGDGSSILIFGDSMFEWHATKFLSQNFSNTTYVFDYNIRESIVDYVQPDVVIYEMTERFWSTYPDKNQSFLQTPLSDFSSEILNCEVKDNVLSVEVKNTSTQAWKSMDLIRCGIFHADGTDTSIRASLGKNTTVAPGESVTFVFDLKDIKLTDGMTVGLLQETVRYFNEKAPILD